MTLLREAIVRASCRDDTGHRTDSTCCTDIVRRAGPRTAAARQPRPLQLLAAGRMDPTVRETSDLSGTPGGTIRVVPMPPILVRMLRRRHRLGARVNIT